MIFKTFRIVCLFSFLFFNLAFAESDVTTVEKAVNAIGIELHLRMMADEGNKVAPYMIDKETQYATAIAIGKRLTTQWVFIKRSKVDFNVTALKESMTEQGLARLCTNPVTQMLIDRYGATFSHTYSDKDGIFLFAFNGDRSACKAIARQ